MFRIFKKSKKIRILVMIGFFFIIVSTLLTTNILYDETNIRNTETYKDFMGIRLAEIRGEIKIYSDGDFTPANGTRSGSGTEIDPYVISNWNIINPISGICIEIVNTTKYFEIINCTLSNAKIGTQIENASNVKIINCTIFNITGIDGANGGADTDGSNGDKAYGISISNCSYVNITKNIIYDIFGGSGGNGGVGSNGESGNPGRIGGNGSYAYGVLVNKTLNISITYNLISSIIGGNGGDGGIGGNSYDDNGNPGGIGGSGGLGGMAIGLYILNSNFSDVLNNKITNITGSNGGNGGLGGNGSNRPIIFGTGGMGGAGGSGSPGGFCTGIFSENLINFSLLSNNISFLWGGLGGNGGNGGMGGNSTSGHSTSRGGTGGFGGFGGIGGSVYGFTNSISLNITNKWNNFSYIFGGKGGDSGNGGIGGNISIWGTFGDGGDVGFGGDGGYASGIYFAGSININDYSNIILLVFAGNGGDGGNGGLPGNFTSGALGYHGGDGGNGGDGGKGGNSDALVMHFINYVENDRNNITLISAGNGGSGGNASNGGNSYAASGIYLPGNAGSAGDGGVGGNSTGIYTWVSVNSSNYWNYMFNISGGAGGPAGIAGVGGNFTGLGDGGDATGGNGGNGGSGGGAYGIFTIDSLNLTYNCNKISTIISGNGSSGSDGGSGGVGNSFGGNGGHGGNGGNGGVAFGVKLANSNYTFNFRNNISEVIANKASDGGDGGNGGSGGNYGDGGDGGRGGDGSIGVAMQFISSNNPTNIWNILSYVTGSFGGNAGSGGSSGFGGDPGVDGTTGASNTGYGLYLEKSNESYSYQNYVYIENNTVIGGISNTWNSTTIGNYWAFYKGVDADDNGIGDTPYIESGIIDYLPIWDDGPEPFESVYPRVFINTPTNLTYWSTRPPINVTVIEENFDSLWYRVGSTNIFLTNNTEQLLDSTIWASLAEGPFQIEIYANDTSGNLNSTYTLILYKNTFAPLVVITTPANLTYWNTRPPINVTVIEENFDSLWYRVDSTNIFLTNNTEQLLDSTIWASLAEGPFQIEIYANDTYGNLNDTYTLTLYKDTFAPLVTITTPANQTYWDTRPPINVTVIEENIDSLWYRVGSTNIFLTNNSEQLLDSTIWASLAEGPFQIEIYAEDVAGNINSTYILTLYKETLNPLVVINTPVNQTYWNSPPPINVTVYEGNFDSLWYRVGSTNIFLTNNTEQLLDSTIWASLAEGPFQIEIYANDTSANLNDTYTLTLYKDTFAPLVTITAPANQTYWDTRPPINITVYETDFDSLWYRVGSTNIFLTNNTEQLLDSTIWDSLAEGPFQIEIYANDTYGNLNDTYILTLYKETLNPLVVINIPVNQTYWNSPPPINVTVYEGNFDSLWYRVGSTNIFLTNNTEQLLDSTIWDSLAEGPFQIEIYANDTSGNLNDTYILTLYKDTLIPLVTITTPANQTYWDTPPPINITVFEINFDSLWYRVGSTNIFLTNNSELLLDSTIWASLAEGPFQIEIYANDTYGNLNDTYTLTLYKDTLEPLITINNPLSGEKFGTTAPGFDLTILDTTLNTTWYSINVGTHWYGNITFSGSTGAIDQTLWDSLPEGEITITFYANDSYGRIGHEDVIITKELDGDGEFDLFLFVILISIICGVIVVIAVFIKKKGGYKPSKKAKEQTKELASS